MFLLPPLSVRGQNAPEKLSLQLKWKHSYQFAGYYMALEKGFFREEGLDVAIKEHRPGGKHFINKVLAGESQYGVADTSILLSYSQNKPVVWLSQIYQHSPLILMTRKDSGITSPYELKGRRLAFNEKELSTAPIRMMLMQTLGKDVDQVRFGPRYQGESALLTGESDGVLGYLTNEPYWFRQQNIEINIMNPQSYGIDFYGDNLFTSRAEAEEHPDRVKRMIRASLRGWHYALDHPDETIDLVYTRYNPQNQSREHVIYQAAMAEQMIQRELVPLGTVDPGRIKGIYQGLSQMEMVEKKELNLSELLWNQYNPRTKLTPRERTWLNENSQITLSLVDTGPPEVSSGRGRTPEGLVADYIAHIGDALGHRIDLRLYPDRERALEALRRGEVQGTAYLGDSPGPYLPTAPYFQTPYMVFCRKSDKMAVREDADLRGRRIAYAGNTPFIEDYLLRLPDVELVGAKDMKEQFRLLSNGDADAVIGGPVHHFFLHDSLYSDLESAYLSEERIAYRIGINPELPELAGILNKGIRGLSGKDRAEVHKEWISHRHAEEGGKLILSEEERLQLIAHDKILIAVNPRNLPYEGISKNGEFEGILAEYMKIFSARLDIPFELVPTAGTEESLETLRDGLCDILVSNGGRVYAEEGLLPTIPYYRSEFVFALHKRQPLVRDFGELEKETVGVPRGSTIIPILARKYPEMRLVPYDSIEKGLLDVATGRAFAFVSTLPVISYTLHKMALGSVKIGGSVHQDTEFSMLVRKEDAPLVPILNKVIDSISVDEHNRINESWVTITYVKGTDYRLILQIVGVAVLLIGFLFYRHELVKKSNRALKIAKEELKKKNEELNSISMKDPLTGIMNRRAVLPIIENEMKRSDRFDTPVSILVLDLDHFKRVNDSYGHAVGDQVLKKVAATLCSLCRSTDSVSRWGGEEFLILCMDTGGKDAKGLAEKIREKLAGLLFEDSFRVTVSIGVAQYSPGPGSTFQEWFKQGDLALYQAKEGGRNRSVLYAGIGKNEAGSPDSEGILRIKWKPEYQTGNEAIDGQHRELFRLANRVVDEICEAGPVAVIQDLFGDLFRKSREHFIQEEEILKELGKPDLDLHAQEHQDFLEEFERQLNRCRRGDATPLALLEFISRELILGHMLSRDLQVFGFARIEHADLSEGDN